jgi:DNA-binding NtrC family response regulator
VPFIRPARKPKCGQPEGRQLSASVLELGDHVEVAPVSLAQAREVAERQAVELALRRNRGRLGDAAQELGISRVTLFAR